MVPVTSGRIHGQYSSIYSAQSRRAAPSLIIIPRLHSAGHDHVSAEYIVYIHDTILYCTALDHNSDSPRSRFSVSWFRGHYAAGTPARNVERHE